MLRETMNPVVGLPVLRALREIRFDVSDSTLTVPLRPTEMPFVQSNICFNTVGVMDFRARSGGEDLLFNFDTGCDATTLSKSYFERNEEWIRDTCEKDSMRLAGVGGWQRFDTYVLPQFSIEMGGSTVKMDSVAVLTSGAPLERAALDGRLGIDVLDADVHALTFNLESMFVRVLKRLTLDASPLDALKMAGTLTPPNTSVSSGMRTKIPFETTR